MKWKKDCVVQSSVDISGMIRIQSFKYEEYYFVNILRVAQMGFRCGSMIVVHQLCLL